MKKKSLTENENSAPSEDNTVFRQAGELIGTIGAHIAQGTAKVVHFVSDEAAIVKKVIKRKLTKKSTPKKKAANKVSTKAANKQVKSTTRKKVKKGEKKFTAKAKKPANKTSSNRMNK